MEGAIAGHGGGRNRLVGGITVPRHARFEFISHHSGGANQGAAEKGSRDDEVFREGVIHNMEGAIAGHGLVEW